ncbi:unnamed protein product [Sphagnum troendelagicum]|uniref:VOC domain-containing protein n=1 Tax=Sphagnum troendelagicum TaxID=128251 RepID=A0ABP0TIU5_9BRYO
MAGILKNRNPLGLTSLNHVSRNCADLNKSVQFYEIVLGFVPIKRPGSFDFDGAWLYHPFCRLGIHLLQAEKEDMENAILAGINREINPRDDHISFQCEDIVQVENSLRERNIKSTRRVVEEGGIMVDQLFFHDPDGFMIEICNCEKLPVEPLATSAAVTAATCSSLRRCSSLIKPVTTTIPMGY